MLNFLSLFLLWIQRPPNFLFHVRSISNYHHLLNFSFLLKSIVSQNDSVLLVTLIKIKLVILWKRRVLCFDLIKFWRVVVAGVHEHVLNCLLSHLISTCNISIEALNRHRLLTVDLLWMVPLYFYFVKIWIKICLWLSLFKLIILRHRLPIFLQLRLGLRIHFFRHVPVSRRFRSYLSVDFSLFKQRFSKF